MKRSDLQGTESVQLRALPGYFWAAVSFAIMCLGLAGISDGYVEWKNWIESGFMLHWRNAKQYVYDHVFFWVPFKIPPGLIDYCLIGSTFLKAMYFSQGRQWRKQFFGMEFDIPYESALKLSNPSLKNSLALLARILFFPIAKFVMPVFVILIWPGLLVVHSVRSFMPTQEPKIDEENLNYVVALFRKRGVVLSYEEAHHILQEDYQRWRANDLAIVRLFFLSLVFFVPVLFVATNELPAIFGADE